MKDVYGISRYVDYLVYQYIIIASRLYSADVVTRPFTYSFDIFIRCNNSRHVTISKCTLNLNHRLIFHSYSLSYHTKILHRF